MIWFHWKDIKSDVYLDGVIKIDKTNFDSDKYYIQEGIDLFNSEIQWDGMFTLEVAKKRIFENDEITFILTHNGEVLGHSWHDMMWWYNIYISKKRPQGISVPFCKHFFNEVEYDELYGYTDWWNVAATKLFIKTGATVLHPLKVMF